MGLAGLFQGDNAADIAARALYQAAVAKARDPAFYTSLAVPDTVDGRFDMIVIHVMLVLRRLRQGAGEAPCIGRSLLELMITDLDRSLREMGVGDMSVGKHIRKMVQAFVGRAGAYEQALDAGGDQLERTLKDNVYRLGGGGDVEQARMATYIRSMWAHLSAQAVSALIVGRVDFAGLPTETDHAHPAAAVRP